MAVAIEATAGSASANSFATLAEAETFMEARLNASLWDAATDDTKNRALVEATRELTNLSWSGQRADDTQALAWPRQWVCNPDSPTPGFFYDSTEIPQRVKDAQMELAFQFVKSGTTDVAALPSSNDVASKTIDVITTDYVEPSQRARGLARFPRVLSYIAPLLESVGAGSFRVVRS